jgi:hypothetical protein
MAILDKTLTRHRLSLSGIVAKAARFQIFTGLRHLCHCPAQCGTIFAGDCQQWLA